ncbi:MAG: arsenite methyltransferase [Anaerolineaceae bacterium]|nr:arsenite methyltransferase [Anaerolineaceae bacterium]
MAMRDAVQDAYGARAASSEPCGCSSESCCSGDSAPMKGEAACCSSSEDSVSILPDYASEDLSDAPQEAAEFSLGCGNPLAMADLKPGEVVLDIGSGGGLDSFLAARRVGPAGKVIGVDMTPAMLERARASAQRTGIGNVEFRQGYAEAMPVEASTVDVIMSNCVINLTEDKGQVFREAFRALRPGGRLEVSDIVTSGALPVEAMEDRYSWAECISGALPEQEYLDLIAQAGFEAVQVRRKTNAGTLAGVEIYSAIVSAKKPAIGEPAGACC